MKNPLDQGKWLEHLNVPGLTALLIVSIVGTSFAGVDPISAHQKLEPRMTVVHQATAEPATFPKDSRASGKDWTNLFSDNFESPFPGDSWTIYSPDNVPHWGAWECWSGNSATHSAACAAAGTGAIVCGGLYPANMATWMIAGPFDLSHSGLTACELSCVLQLFSETNNDYFLISASTDLSNFYGYQYSNIVLDEAITLDLADVPGLGSVLGQPQVWIGFYFTSDWSISFGEGAQIDDVLLRADMLPPNQPPTVTVNAPNGGETWFANDQQTITYTANDPDTGPAVLSVDIDYSLDGGGSWNVVAADQANSGNHLWILPQVTSNQARIRIRVDDGEDQNEDISDADFSIVVPGQNTMALGSSSGASGAEVSLALSLENEDLVRGVQADIVFNSSVAAFTSVSATGRGADMVATSQTIASGRGRILLFFDQMVEISPGQGDFALLTFALQGAGGANTSLAIEDMVLSGPEGESWFVTGQGGSLLVDPPTEVPVVQVVALKNPGRTRTVQVMVKVINGSGSIPTVTVAGVPLVVVSVGGGLYQGLVHAHQGANNITIEASDTNIIGTGTDQDTVGFP